MDLTTPSAQSPRRIEVRFVPDPNEPSFVNPIVRLLHPTSDRVLLSLSQEAFKRRTSLEQRYHCKRHGWRRDRHCSPCRRRKR